MISEGKNPLRKSPQLCSFRQPLAILQIRFAPGQTLDVRTVDDADLQSRRLQHFIDGQPIHPGGFHRHGGHVGGKQRVPQRIERLGEGVEHLHRAADDGGVEFLAAHVDAGSVWIDRAHLHPSWSRVRCRRHARRRGNWLNLPNGMSVALRTKASAAGLTTQPTCCAPEQFSGTGTHAPRRLLPCCVSPTTTTPISAPGSLAQPIGAAPIQFSG